MIIVDKNQPSYRGNTHVHTTSSDGNLPINECTEIYRKLGHDFLVITDHWHINEETHAGNMLVMRGVEYDFAIPNQALHIVGILPQTGDPDITRRDSPERAVLKINAMGGAAILAHPAWSMNTPDIMLALPEICGAEIFNAVSGLPYGNDRAYSGTQLDICSNYGRLLHMFTGDDTHYYNGECGQGVNVVQAESLSSKDIIEAFKRGKSYCTQGPRIDYAAYDPKTRVYSVECSPASYITFYSNNPWTPKRCITGTNLTSGEYHLVEYERYIRCEVIDKDGKRAWISPVSAE